MIHKGALRGKILSPSTAFGLLPLYDIALSITYTYRAKRPALNRRCLLENTLGGQQRIIGFFPKLEIQFDIGTLFQNPVFI
ncbi:MAG TPA: hypothetical protein ENG47_01830 [Candidatus Aerophobetes bacterium]|uniref:Uncharacterized protein n=1 Tax=Aerophobetes bacterium TaxID=2030807 RepID=A0A7V0QQ63_UNCAE|nr:hypothetical protein [Candidatus Aerophobetes bacterium]